MLLLKIVEEEEEMVKMKEYLCHFERERERE